VTAVLRLLRRPEIRRIVGIVAVLAFVLLLVHGAAHAADHDGGADHCSICAAHAQICTSETFAPPQIAEPLDAEDPLVLPRYLEPRVHVLDRSHTSRGPPASP
jgi:hypothetical protein